MLSFQKITHYIRDPFVKHGFRKGAKILVRKLTNFYLYKKKNHQGFLNHNVNLAIKVLKSGKWSESPYPSQLATKFSQEFTDFHHGKYGLCVSNGTVAFAIALKAAGLKYGDEILMPAITFHSTAATALEFGIIPKFIDIERKTLCIDPLEIEQAITSKTKAIIVVHLGAMVADLDTISKICQKHNLTLIEDCAHAHGAMWGNYGIGSYGDFSCFSFQSSKLINCGEGGFIMTKEKNHWARCLSYINCGRGSDPFSILGVNHRLTEIHCAILLDSLSNFRLEVLNRDANVRYFTEEISKISGIEVLVPYKKQTRQTGYFYGFRLSNDVLSLVSRKEVVNNLCSQGFYCHEKLYAPVYLTPEFGWKDSPIPVSYSDTKCIEAEKANELDIIWIGHFYFGQRRSLIDFGISTLKNVFNNIYLKKNNTQHSLKK